MADNGRKYPRLPVAVPVQAGGVMMTTVNVSMVGAQFACPAMRYELNAERLGARPLPVSVLLPGTDALETQVDVTYVSESEDEVLIGVCFDALGNDARGQLAGFLEQRGGARYTQPGS